MCKTFFISTFYYVCVLQVWLAGVAAVGCQNFDRKSTNCLPIRTFYCTAWRPHCVGRTVALDPDEVSNRNTVGRASNVEVWRPHRVGEQ
jgi:hypothetical protein